MKKIRDFFIKLIQSDSKESSKRFKAFLALLISGGLSFAYTNTHNITMILPMWLTFILVLMGLATWEKQKK